MHIISGNEPLLFVQSPPVFIRIDFSDDESTSVFVQTWEEALRESDEIEQEVGEQDLEVEVEEKELEVKEIEQEVNPSITRRIGYLEGAFQKKVYQPLQFDLGDDSLTGAIDKVDGNTVFIMLRGEEQEIVAVEMNTIEEISWRGKPFAEI